MEDNGGDGGSNAHWWWALAGATQFGWGIASFRRGFIGNSSLMPFKAFAVASLFVGAAASSAIASLKASGIHKVTFLLCIYQSHFFSLPPTLD